MRFKIVGYEPKDPTSYNIEYWYDRRQRLWIVTVYGDTGVEVESITIQKVSLKSVIEYLAKKYETEDVRKI